MLLSEAKRILKQNGFVLDEKENPRSGYTVFDYDPIELSKEDAEKFIAEIGMDNVLKVDYENTYGRRVVDKETDGKIVTIVPCLAQGSSMKKLEDFYFFKVYSIKNNLTMLNYVLKMNPYKSNKEFSIEDLPKLYKQAKTAYDTISDEDWEEYVNGYSSSNKEKENKELADYYSKSGYKGD